MDSLTYHYGANDNKLTYIDDKQTGALSVYKGDLKDQASGNYGYSLNGNLIKDTRDSINSITWTNAQKIKKITKSDRYISFAYDAMQNRVVKYSKPNANNTEKRTYYIRDAQGNVMATYSGQVQNVSGTITWDTLRLAEQHIYGSARVGAALPNVKLYPAPPKNPHLADTSQYPIFEGGKHYEISNHLGNVLAVITDRKRGNAVSGSSIQWFDVDVVASQQYYPFGMLMPDTSDVELRRQYSNPNCFDKDYRYGFNGKEGDDEIKGDDNQQDYGMRIYDPRVGRFLSVDPIARGLPDLSPFSFAGNSVIWLNDYNGREPDRNQAGTIEQAINQWRSNGLTTAEEIRNFIQHNENAVQFVYTEQKGWIDLQHYFGTLTYGKIPMDALEPASGNFFLQETIFGPDANSSYFSYEDLPSNQFAEDSRKDLVDEYLVYGKDEFLVKKTKLKKGEELLAKVLEKFSEVKATLPTNAPNWNQIPFRDHDERERLPEKNITIEDGGLFKEEIYSEQQKKDLLGSGKYVPQNKTNKPYNLNNFPAAPSSLEKGDKRRGATGF